MLLISKLISSALFYNQTDTFTRLLSFDIGVQKEKRLAANERFENNFFMFINVYVYAF